jgi:squalene-hopene/tetraprenyl-beta-curcumene cyclase
MGSDTDLANGTSRTARWFRAILLALSMTGVAFIIRAAVNPKVCQYCSAGINVPPASAAEPIGREFSLRTASAYVEGGAAIWTREYKCVTCHTNGAYMLVRPMLTAYLGQPELEQHQFFLSVLKQQLADDKSTLESDLGPAQSVYVAAGLAAWDANITGKPSPETEAALKLMFRLQRSSGTWKSNDCWPPFESSAYQLATVAAMAAGTAPGWANGVEAAELRPELERLKVYLRAERGLQGDYDRTALLWAAGELPDLLDARRKQELVAMIFQHQLADGGWSIRTFARPEQWGSGNRAGKLRSEREFAAPASDGHMTGLAIVALRKAGVDAADPRIQRAISWLLHNQRISGRWWTRSLNTDKWHFITYSGTLYPLLGLALCGQLPVLPPGSSQ